MFTCMKKKMNHHLLINVPKFAYTTNSVTMTKTEGEPLVHHINCNDCDCEPDCLHYGTRICHSRAYTTLYIIHVNIMHNYWYPSIDK